MRPFGRETRLVGINVLLTNSELLETAVDTCCKLSPQFILAFATASNLSRAGRL
jgi:hypothetical protein